MPSRVIRDYGGLVDVFKLLRNLAFPFTLEWRAGATRSHPQNNTMWGWAGEFAEQLGDRTAKEVQAEWKLTIGVPILRSENEGFCSFYDKAIKPLTYTEKLDAMKYTPVSSIMTVKQMTAFMEAIMRQAAEQGVRLTIPEEE